MFSFATPRRVLLQALSACGGGIFVAQLLIYPRIVVQIGPRRTQRWLCCVAIPVYLAYPLLSQIRDSGGVLMTVSVIMLVVTNFAVYTVGDAHLSMQCFSAFCSR